MVKCCVAHGKSKFLLWQDRQIPFLPLQFRAFWDVKRTILRSTCSLGWNRDCRSWGHSDSGSAPLEKTSLCLVSFHGGPSRNLPGGSAGGRGQRTQTSQPSRTRGFHAASGRRACGALNKGLETCLQRPLPQLPVEKRDEFLALQKGCGTWLSLQHAQSRAGLSPTATVLQPSQDSPRGWLVGTMYPTTSCSIACLRASRQHCLPRRSQQAPDRFPKDPPFRASFYVFTTLSKTIHFPYKYC